MDVCALSKGKKLVHLDLKGAPPRINYLYELIQLFADLGANGILIEYEDMFPYEGELKILQSKSHTPYSREEITAIQDLAYSRGLEIIPLVQTFGHLEFVLKHSTFSKLREVSYCLGTLNPHSQQGLTLILEMLHQVMRLHPRSTVLHIGADEVYMLGQGEESKEWLSVPGHTIDKLFLSHATKVAKGIRETYPSLSVIMWDDMLRNMTSDTIKDSGLIGLVQPMLWDYSPDLDVAHSRSFTQEAQHKVMEALGTGTTEVGDVESLSQGCSRLYTGMKLAELIVQLTAMLESEDLRHFESNMYVRGWFSPYHRQQKTANPLFAQQIQKQAQMIVETVELKVQEVRQEMNLLYPDLTVEEWVTQHVTPVLKPIQDLLMDIQTVLEDMGVC
ncbi:hexosaminidase D isoform X2 [Neoarius graeffei]|uniref:hexosaminidase D isoform X2 n=1 Tax=Neoarius graeffei TaxID=443677 RepID=UPI00298BD6C3|nr:hexosaminidase D isoform X2 [Neoarius graeffei]